VRPPGPICPGTLAKNIVKSHVRDLKAVFGGSTRTLARVRVFGTKVTTSADGADLETTESIITALSKSSLRCASRLRGNACEPLMNPQYRIIQWHIFMRSCVADPLSTFQMPPEPDVPKGVHQLIRH
jgi:hypothetical protein